MGRLSAVTSTTAEIEILKSQIARQAANNRDLQKKFDNLLAEHTQLREEHQQAFQNNISKQDQIKNDIDRKHS